MTAPLTRRGALSGAATLGVTLPLLAACGDDGDGTASDSASSDTPAGSAPGSETTTETTTESGGGGAGLVATSEVPVGSGVVLKDEELVVAQPSPGEFKAYKAICTHQGCLVGSVADGSIVCPCHGSRFSIADGSPTGGPAQTPLAEVAVKVSGDQVTRA